MNRRSFSLLAIAILSFVLPSSAYAQAKLAGGLFNAADFILGITGPLFEVLILPFAAVILALAGSLMDSAISFSINSAYIFSMSPAINIGWSIIRDIANIFFIFILIYISLGTIVRAGSFQTKKLLTSVIIAAILINFSMFFTKAIIDVSNIFGGWLYKGIEKTLEVNSIPGNPVALSGLIADRLGIAQFWAGGDTLDKSAPATQSGRFTNSLLRLTVVLVATYVFAYTTILFLARSIELLILLVFAPIGFVGGLLPQTKKYADEWWGELSNVAVFPVAYLLMLYIAMQFINSLSLVQARFEKMTVSNQLVYGGMNIMTYFQYFIIIFLLLACLKVAKENSGKLGDTLGGFAKQLGQMAVGTAVGIGTGGVGFLGRNIVGRVASRVAQNEGFQAFAGRSLVGELALKGTRGIAKSSFDMRRTATLKNTLGQIVPGGIGEGRGEGGYEKKLDEQTKAREEFGKSLFNETKDRYGNPIAPANTARNRYAERLRTSIIGGGIPPRLGGVPSVISTVLGRADRVASAKMINGLIAERRKEVAELTTERNQLQQLEANGGVLTPYQTRRLAAAGAGSIADDITTASTEIDRLRAIADNFTQVQGQPIKARTVEKTGY